MASNDSLASDLEALDDSPRIVSFGDCLAPSIIARVVYAGHRFARTLTMDLNVDAPFWREDVTMAAE